MSIIRNAANTKRTGRIGETTYYVSKGRQIARQALNNTNYGAGARRSQAQQTRRVKWANLVNFYKASTQWISKAFETKKPGQTDYNKLMQLNVNATTISLTKDQAVNGSSVVAGYQVSQGSLPSLEVSKYTNQWACNISLGSLETITAETTVAQFSQAVTAANRFLAYGMQISFVSYQQTLDAMGYPRVISAFYEVTLNETSTELLWSYIPAFGASAVNGFLGTNTDVSKGAFCWLLSDLRSGVLKVSSQVLITNNVELIALYSTPAQVEAAILSYGVDQEVALNPDTIQELTPVPQPNYIQWVVFKENTYYPNGVPIVITESSTNDIKVMFANLVQPARYGLTLRSSEGDVVSVANEVTEANNYITFPITSLLEQFKDKSVITLVVDNRTTGEEWAISFQY